MSITTTYFTPDLLPNLAFREARFQSNTLLAPTSGPISSFHKEALGAPSLYATKRGFTDTFIFQNEEVLGHQNHLLVIYDPEQKVQSLPAYLENGTLRAQVYFQKVELDYATDLTYLELCRKESPSETYYPFPFASNSKTTLIFKEIPADFSYVAFCSSPDLEDSPRRSTLPSYEDVIYFTSVKGGLNGEGVEESVEKRLKLNFPPKFGSNPTKLNNLGATSTINLINYRGRKVTLTHMEKSTTIETLSLVRPFYLGDLSDLLDDEFSLLVAPYLYLEKNSAIIDRGLTTVGQFFRDLTTVDQFYRPEFSVSPLVLDVEKEDLVVLDTTDGLTPDIFLEKVKNLPWYWKAELSTRFPKN